MPGQKRRTHQSKPNPRHLEWSNLVLKGHSYREIAARHGVTHSAVFKAVRRVEELERPELAEERRRIKHAVTGRLNWVLAEASTAWERSKEPTVTEEIDDKGVTRRRTTTSSGNPQFLREFRAANSELSDLWGVQGAIQHEEHETHEIEPSHMTDEEFEASIAASRQQRDRRIRMRKKLEEHQQETARQNKARLATG
jgi:hypothetical protein